MQVNDIRNIFQLTDGEYRQINTCVRNYAQDLSVSSLRFRIKNAIMHLFGESDWQKGEKILVRPALLESVCHFNKQESANAHKVSLFVLNFFVTLESLARGHHQRLVTFDARFLINSSIHELLLAAAYGDGKTYVSPSEGVHARVVKKITATLATLQQEVQAFITYFQKDPRLLMARQLSAQVSPTTQRLVGLGIMLQTAQQPSLDEQLQRMIEEAQTLIQHTQEILTRIAMISIPDCNQLASGAQELLVQFRENVTFLRTPVRSPFGF